MQIIAINVKKYKFVYIILISVVLSLISCQYFKLSTPENIVVSNDNSNKLTIQWNYASGADSYIIYRSTNLDTDYQIICKSTLSNGYDDITASAGKIYFYKVSSFSLLTDKESLPSAPYWGIIP